MSHMTAKPTAAQLKEMARHLGRRGGLAKSDAKTKAAQANAKRPRPNRRKTVAA